MRIGDRFQGGPTYINPIFPRSFPDPFVLKFCGEYFGYCTGRADEHVFGIVHSRNLTDWEWLGGAMKRLDPDPPCYWAPEVTYSNGKFYLYYSSGNEAFMEVRVAISDRPDGGFRDCGKSLTTEEFAIDPHVFTDEDGQRYLFYATDFLAHNHIGTGTVVDRLLDWFTPAGNPKPVTRARYDWQVYDPHRTEKGGVRWHTVEGPFVIKHKGTYFEMFSGGNWKNLSYGVSFAVSETLNGGSEWKQFSDGIEVLPILRTIPDKVIGPGHNSVVIGPNNRELFCVYHAWRGDERVMSVDRMDVTGERIFLKGPTFTPQPQPFTPCRKFNNKDSWTTKGAWVISDFGAANDSFEVSEMRTETDFQSYLLEFSLRFVELKDDDAHFGLQLKNEEGISCEIILIGVTKRIIVDTFAGRTVEYPLPDDFDPWAFHHIRMEIDLDSMCLYFDGRLVKIGDELLKFSTSLAFIAKNAKIEIKAVDVTAGFEDLFHERNPDRSLTGWNVVKGTAGLEVIDRQLIIANRGEVESIVAKGWASRHFEFAVNVKVIETFGDDAAWGFVILDRDSVSELINFPRTHYSELQNIIDDLPGLNVPREYRQFRVLKDGEHFRVESENLFLAELTDGHSEAMIGISVRNVKLGLDMARYTLI